MLIRNETFLDYTVTMNFIYDDPECNKAVKVSVGDIVKVHFNCPRKRCNISCTGQIAAIDTSRVKSVRSNIHNPYCQFSDEVIFIIDCSKEYSEKTYRVCAKDIIDMSIYDKDNKSITVRNQFELDCALKDDDIDVIKISTVTDKIFNIPEGFYDNKILIIDAPRSNVQNHGVFKYIQVDNNRSDNSIGYTDCAVGNSIIMAANDRSNINIGTDAITRKVYTDSKIIDIIIMGYLQKLELDSNVNIVNCSGNNGTDVYIPHDNSVTINNSTDKVIYVNIKDTVVETVNPGEGKVVGIDELKPDPVDPPVENDPSVEDAPSDNPSTEGSTDENPVENDPSNTEKVPTDEEIIDTPSEEKPVENDPSDSTPEDPTDENPVEDTPSDNPPAGDSTNEEITDTPSEEQPVEEGASTGTEETPTNEEINKENTL